MQIKLIAVDIGGTLINDNNEISKEDINTFKLLKKLNIPVTLLTARMYSSTKYISNQICSEYGVFGNGSIVMSTKNKEILYANTIQYLDKEQLIKFGQENNLYIHFNQFFYEGSNEEKYFLLKHKILNEKYPINLKSNIIKTNNIRDYILSNNDIVNIIFVSENNTDNIYEKIKNSFPNVFITEYNKNTYENVIDKVINYIEIGSTMATKATGLDILINKLGLDRNEVLVIGNGDNDVDIFKIYPNSGCLSNGSDIAKKYASYISQATNNESGVSEIVKKYIKRR